LKTGQLHGGIILFDCDDLDDDSSPARPIEATKATAMYISCIFRASTIGKIGSSVMEFIRDVVSLVIAARSDSA